MNSARETEGTGSGIGGNWLLPLAAAVVAVDVVVAQAGPMTRAVEAGLLLDLVVLLPCFYLFSAGRKAKAGLVRAVGLACLGIWVATKLIPVPDRMLLVYIAPLRYVGLVVLVLLELAVARLIYKTVTSSGSPTAAAQRASTESGMPLWVARLIAWEMSIWSKVIRWGKGLLGRGRGDA